MATVIGALAVKLGLDADDLTDDLAKVDRRFKGFSRSVARSGARLKALGPVLDRAGRRMTKFVSGGLAAGATAAFEFTRRMASAADVVAKSARAAGLAGASFQEITFALGQMAGVSQEQASMALNALNRRIGLALEGNKAYAETIQALGIDLQGLRDGTVSTEQVFDAYVKALENTKSSAEAAALASTLFGDEVGKKLGSAIRSGQGDLSRLREEFRAAGLTISDETLAASEKFGDQLDVLNRQFKAVAIQLAGVLLPILSDVLVPFIQNTVIPAIQSAGEAVGEWIQWFKDLPAPVQEAIGVVAAAIGVGGPILVAIGFLSKALGALVAASGPIGLFIAAAGLIFAAWQVWGDDIKALTSETFAVLTEAFTVFRDFMTELWTGLTSLMTELWERTFGVIIQNTLNTVEGIKQAWQFLSDTLVGNSIITDMLDMMVDKFDLAHSSIVAGSREAASEVEKSYSRASKNTTSLLGDMVSEVSGVLGQLFGESKAFAIAQALVNVAEGVTKTLSAYPWPISGILAGLHAAAGAVQIAAIKRSSKGGGGSVTRPSASGGAVANAGSVAAGQAQQSSTVTVQGLGVGDIFSGQQIRELIGRFNEETQDGVLIKVV